LSNSARANVFILGDQRGK